MVKIFAHRGASGYELENTMKAFRLAIEQQADGIELDVQLSLDNYLIVFHDESLKRVFGVDKYVKDLTFKELLEISNNQICLLEDVLQLIKQTTLELNIEIKNSVFDYENIEEMTYDLVSKYELNDRVSYSSFNHNSCHKIKKINANNKVGILYESNLDHIGKYAKEIGADYLNPDFKLLANSDLINESKEYNLPINCWTVNEVEQLEAVKNLNLNIIITNYVDRAKKILG